MNEEQQWPPEWLRGVLELCTLQIVAAGETYGYAVIQQLEEAGLGKIKGGTLYPILNRLEDDGLLKSSWREGDNGPGRKFFAITPEGRQRLSDRTERWQQFSKSVAAVMNTRMGVSR